MLDSNCKLRIKNSSLDPPAHLPLLIALWALRVAILALVLILMEFHRATEVHQGIKEDKMKTITKMIIKMWHLLLMWISITICQIWRTRIKIIKTTILTRVDFSKCNNNQHLTGAKTSLRGNAYWTIRHITQWTFRIKLIIKIPNSRIILHHLDNQTKIRTTIIWIETMDHHLVWVHLDRLMGSNKRT